MHKNITLASFILSISIILQVCSVVDTETKEFQVFETISEDENEVWVVINPIQCLGNPWETDWLENNNLDYSAWAEKSAASKIVVFVNYYENQGISVLEVQQTFSDNDYCSACTCPRGDSIHCLVDVQDLVHLLELGFELE